MVRLSIDIDNISLVLDQYDQLKVYRANSKEGSYTEITDTDTRIELKAGKEIYWYEDEDGTSAYWYKTSYYNSTTAEESELSEPRQGGTEAEKIGWTFGNYAPYNGEWGEVLTADDLRYTYLWGIDFMASNGEPYTDDQVRAKIRSTVREFERALKINLTKKKVLCQPDESLTEGLDYEIAEDPYPYRPHRWTRVGHITLRRAPILSVERFEFYSITGQKILNLLPWIRIDHRKGVIHFFPKAGPGGTIQTSLGIHFTAAGLYFGGIDYPHCYQVDYTVGKKHAGLVDEDLRDIIGKAATCKLLNVIGDGLIAGFSSSSLSMDAMSESFSSTQSATNAYFGARIGVYLKDIENYLKENRNKFGRFVIGSI